MATAARTAKLGRLERPAVTGVLVREIINFSSFWRSATFSSTVEPTIYLLAFGFGFGTLVGTINGFDYVEFVGTGTVATAVLFSSAFPAMFGTFVKYQFQRTYDAILAAPVSTEELVTAEVLWIATRAGVYGCVPMIVAVFFGLDPQWGMLTVPFIAWLSGLGWACFGIMVAGFAKSFENFNYVVSAVLTPLFLVAGTFFPLDELSGVDPGTGQDQSAVLDGRARPRRGAVRVRVGRSRGRCLSRSLRARVVADRDRGHDEEADRLSEIRIEPWAEGDLPLLEKLLGDPAMTEHLGGPEPLKKIAERQERYEQLTDAEQGRMFKIVDGESGEGVGSVGYWERELPEMTVYETGWSVLPAFQGRGIATVATAQCIEQAAGAAEAQVPARVPGGREPRVERDLPQARLRAARRVRVRVPEGTAAT